MANSCGSVTLPANVQDRILNASRYKLSDLQHQAVLEFKGTLNECRLERAVRLSIDAKAILGSHFVEQGNQPYWQRYADLDSIEWLSLEKTINREKTVNKFLTTLIDRDHEQQLKLKLVRFRGNDTLCIKMSHTCCDGGGLKAYYHLLAEIYTKLGQDKNYALEMDTDERKDQNYLLAKLGIVELLKGFLPGRFPLESTWAFPSAHCEPGELLVSLRGLPNNHVKALSSYAKKSGVSVNDLILTAFYRALFRVVDCPAGKPREILITVDLRRYFQDDKVDAINNLSSAVSTRISREPRESFAETLTKVSAATASIKKNLPGIHVAVLFGLLSRVSYAQNKIFVQSVKNLITQTGKCPPILSNVGYISKAIIWFGQTPVVDAYHVSPAVYAPGFMLGACTYNNHLTFTVSYYEPGTSRDKVEHFLDALIQELKSCIGGGVRMK